MDFRFRWTDRLHRRQDFTTVLKRGRRLSSQGLILWVRCEKESTQGPRLGLAISRRYGNAVQRNRLKRVLREIFRLNKASLPLGADMVFGAQPLKCAVEFRTLEPLVKELWHKAQLTPALSPPPPML